MDYLPYALESFKGRVHIAQTCQLFKAFDDTLSPVSLWRKEGWELKECLDEKKV